MNAAAEGAQHGAMQLLFLNKAEDQRRNPRTRETDGSLCGELCSIVAQFHTTRTAVRIQTASMKYSMVLFEWKNMHTPKPLKIQRFLVHSSVFFVFVFRATGRQQRDRRGGSNNGKPRQDGQASAAGDRQQLPRLRRKIRMILFLSAGSRFVDT